MSVGLLSFLHRSGQRFRWQILRCPRTSRAVVPLPRLLARSSVASRVSKVEVVVERFRSRQGARTLAQQQPMTRVDLT